MAAMEDDPFDHEPQKMDVLGYAFQKTQCGCCDDTTVHMVLYVGLAGLHLPEGNGGGEILTTEVDVAISGQDIIKFMGRLGIILEDPAWEIQPGETEVPLQWHVTQAGRSLGLPET